MLMSLKTKTMKAREIEITAPRGQKTKTIQALRDAGCAVTRKQVGWKEVHSAYSDGRVLSGKALYANIGKWDPDRERRYAPRPDQEALIELAQAGMIRITKVSKPEYDPTAPYKRARVRREYVAKVRNLSREQLGEACVKASGYYTVPGNQYRQNIKAHDGVAEILRRVGRAGEQALSDETRYFENFDIVQYDSRQHSGRDWRGVSRAVIASDQSAAILSFVDAGSYLHKNRTWDSYMGPGDEPGGLHHLRISAYLIVRDSSSGERHVLRIPPRFGRYKSATWQRYVDELGVGDADGLIHAATAWTFGLRPDQYQPVVQS